MTPMLKSTAKGANTGTDKDDKSIEVDHLSVPKVTNPLIFG